jgi:ATP-dependent protease ClpP protease subunit
VTNRKRQMKRSVEALQADKQSFVKTSRPVAKLRSGRNDWYRFENSTPDATDIYLYDEIGFWGVTAQDFVTELNQVRTPTINLYINSPGGSVFDGLAMYNSLFRHSARVNVTIDGLAASAASFIAMSGDEINIARNAIMMIHDAWGLAIGGAADMRETADLLDMHSDNIADIYAQRGTGTAAEFRGLMLDETWLTADEAIELGLADNIVNSRDGDEEDPEDSFDLSIFTYAGRSNAPAPNIPQTQASEGSEPPAPDKPKADDPPKDPYESIDWGALSDTLVNSVSRDAEGASNS